MERLYTSNVRINNGNKKCPMGKSNFAVNLPLKLLRATVTNADAGSLKSLHTCHTLFDTYFNELFN